MKKEEIFDLVNEFFYNSKPIVPSSKQSLKTIKLIEECFNKLKLTKPVSLVSLDMSLKEIDECIDIVSDVLCAEGFDSNSEPTLYGLELESAITFLLHFRYVWVDDHDKLRELAKRIKR